jgi:phage FluMu protein Com
MPIRFRCAYCNRLLGIATRKAGTETTCPHCGYTITVPYPDDGEKTERVNLADVEALLKRPAAGEPPVVDAAEVTQKSGVLTAPPPAPPKALVPPAPPAAKPVAPAAPKAKPPALPKKPRDPNESGLFEGDIDELLGGSESPILLERPAEAQKNAPGGHGTDARSLGDPAQHLTLSSRAATLLMALVLVLLVLAFALGYYVAPHGK